MEESNDGSLVLRSLLRVNRGWREGLPQDSTTYVSRNEELDAGAKTVALLKHLVEKHDDDAREKELEDDQSAVNWTDVIEIPEHAREKISSRLAHGNENREQLLSRQEEAAVIGRAHIDINEVRTGHKL